MKRASVFSLLLVFFYAASVPIASALCAGSSSPIDSFPISSIVVNGNVTVQIFNKKSDTCFSQDKTDSNEENTSNKVSESISKNITESTLNKVIEGTLKNVTENTCSKVVQNCTCKNRVIQPPKIPTGFNPISVSTKDNNTYVTTIKFHKEKKTWNEAWKTCYQEGGFLSYPTNAQETELYKKLMRSNGEGYLWTGIHDLFEQGKYTTILGEVAQNVAHMQWEKNQPDNWKNNEKCIQVTLSGLNDISCDTKCTFVCKVKLPRCE